MESTRQRKVSRLLQKEISIIFQQNLQHTFAKIMLSVTSVRVSPDLSYAKIFLSIFPVKNPKEILELVKQNTPLVRKFLGKNIRNQLRIVPELDFFLDDSGEYVDQINRLIKK